MDRDEIIDFLELEEKYTKEKIIKWDKKIDEIEESMSYWETKLNKQLDDAIAKVHYLQDKEIMLEKLKKELVGEDDRD